MKTNEEIRKSAFMKLIGIRAFDVVQDITRADERERVIQEIENWSLWKGDNSPREKLALFFIALNSLKTKSK